MIKRQGIYISQWYLSEGRKHFLCFRRKDSPLNDKYAKEKYTDNDRNKSLPREDQLNQSHEPDHDNGTLVCYKQGYSNPSSNVSTNNYNIQRIANNSNLT